MNAYQKYKAIQAVGYSVEVPWEYWTIMNTECSTITIMEDKISIGSEFGTLEECREALRFYVNQLGGKVKWNI